MASTDVILTIIENMANAIIEKRSFLTDLDRDIGDGDHGINMSKGFNAVLDKLDTMKGKDVGAMLKDVAMALISTVGGAAGPLYGTAFLRAAGPVNGKEELDSQDIVNIFHAAIEGVKMRGKAVEGEKTMLDALIPAYNALKEAYENGADNLEAFNKAEEAALGGFEFTKTIKATKGRASYLGERSIGFRDPGAGSTHIIIESIRDSLEQLNN